MTDTNKYYAFKYVYRAEDFFFFFKFSVILDKLHEFALNQSTVPQSPARSICRRYKQHSSFIALLLSLAWTDQTLSLSSPFLLQLCLFFFLSLLFFLACLPPKRLILGWVRIFPFFLSLSLDIIEFLSEKFLLSFTESGSVEKSDWSFMYHAAYMKVKNISSAANRLIYADGRNIFLAERYLIIAKSNTKIDFWNILKIFCLFSLIIFQ